MSFNPPRVLCRAEGGCTQIAHGISRFCARHLKAYTVHGHTEGRAIRVHELKPYRRLAAHLLKTYRDRKDTSAALQWLDKVLRVSPEDAAGVELARLHDAGVTADEMFCAALSVWAFHRDRPRSLPDDARLTFALGRAIVRLRKRRRVFARSSLRMREGNVRPEDYRPREI